jgi:hypothetical protein
MLRGFPIDFIRATFEQKLLEQHIANPNFFGGKDQVSILSFYEQLKSQDDVDRFVETYRDLADQQNRTGLILNGVLVAPENPSITNLYSSLIVPMTFTCSLRTKLSNRDQGIITINNLIEKLKGRKVDIAQLNCVDENGNRYYTPFVVGTIGQGQGKPVPANGDFYGVVGSAGQVLNLKMVECFDLLDIMNTDATWFYCEYQNKIVVVEKSVGKQVSWLYTQDVVSVKTNNNDYIYEIDIKLTSTGVVATTLPIYSKITQGTIDIVDNNNETHTIDCDVELTKYEKDDTGHAVMYLSMKLKTLFDDDDRQEIGDANIDFYDVDMAFIEDDGTHKDILFPPTHDSFEKFKLSFSFDAIRCDEPRNLNGEEYCELSFGGSATLVNNGVKLGNDLLKIKVSKYKIPASPSDITFATNDTYLEPLELPSGNNINTNPNQLVSNLFKTNSHADAIALTLQYTFICDENIPLLEQWYNYARYGTIGTGYNDISPNIIYKVNEYWCSWGNFKNQEILTKIVGDMDIENTESDTLTISLSMAIQGENN